MYLLRLSAVAIVMGLTGSSSNGQQVDPAPGKGNGYNGRFTNRIGGSDLPMCARPFLDRHQDLKADVSQLSGAVVQVQCGTEQRYFASGVYIDTPSKRLVLTVEHAISHYGVENGKFKLTHVGKVESCRVIDPGTQQSVQVDTRIRARMGHAPENLSLDGTEDWLVLPLEKPLTTAPLPLATALGTRNAPLIMAGSLGLLHDGVPCTNMTTCQVKSVTSTYHDGKSRAPYYYTDCSSVSGDSGGAITMKDHRNRQVLAAILVGSVIQLPDGSPWDMTKMNTAGLGIGGPLRAAILATETELRQEAMPRR